MGVLLYHLGAFSGEDFGEVFPTNMFLRALGSLSSEVAGIPFSGLEVRDPPESVGFSPVSCVGAGAETGAGAGADTGAGAVFVRSV